MIFETKYRLQALMAWEKMHEEQRLAEEAAVERTALPITRKSTERLQSPLIMLFTALFAWFARN
ncbi:MAG TPA: hypothetical protein VFV52_00200 [Bacilli bacterium]|nr:hypothetical protein [Bacilli bacterium]